MPAALVSVPSAPLLAGAGCAVAVTDAANKTAASSERAARDIGDSLRFEGFV
jgi:hypothetical protein